MDINITVITLFIFLVFLTTWWNVLRLRKLKAIDDAKILKVNILLTSQFPNTIKSRLVRSNPTWSEQTTNNAIKAFKDYLALFILEPKRKFGMPSVGVDEVWHAFLFYPKEYNLYCQKYIDKKLTHTPNNNQVGDGKYAGKFVLDVKNMDKDIINTYFTMRHYSNKINFSRDHKGYFSLFTFDFVYGIPGWLYTEQFMDQLSTKKYTTTDNSSSGGGCSGGTDISISSGDGGDGGGSCGGGGCGS